MPSVVGTDSLIVPVKVMSLVTCVRLRPTHVHGDTPALRLDLIGCCKQGVKFWSKVGQIDIKWDKTL